MKAKTRSSAKSRIRKTGTGKIKIMKTGRKHLLQQKSSRQKRKGKTGNIVRSSPAHNKQIKRAMPYL